MQSNTIRGACDELRAGLLELTKMTDDEMVGDINQLYEDVNELEELIADVIIAVVEGLTVDKSLGRCEN